MGKIFMIKLLFIFASVCGFCTESPITSNNTQDLHFSITYHEIIGRIFSWIIFKLIICAVLYVVVKIYNRNLLNRQREEWNEMQRRDMNSAQMERTRQGELEITNINEIQPQPQPVSPCPMFPTTTGNDFSMPPIPTSLNEAPSTQYYMINK